jgi:hypothetical protein
MSPWDKMPEYEDYAYIVSTMQIDEVLDDYIFFTLKQQAGSMDQEDMLRWRILAAELRKRIPLVRSGPA